LNDATKTSSLNTYYPMKSKQRRQLLLAAASAAAITASTTPLQALARSSVVPKLATRNTYLQTNLAASSASYNAAFTFSDMVDAWGIAIRPAGAGGHFWVAAGGKSYQFVGDVTASATPALRTLFQDGLAEVTVEGADALTTAASFGKTTGTAFNGAPIDSAKFRITKQTALKNEKSVRFNGSARFAFVTDSGTITGWTDRAADGSTLRVNGPTQLVFDGAPMGMSFFGVAFKTDTWDAMWVTDFGVDPQIRQFNALWELIPTQGFVNPFATGALVDAARPEAGNKARPTEPVPFNIQVVNNRVFVAYCISQVLRNEQGFIVDAGQFFAGEEDSLDAAGEDKAGGFPNKGKLVEYTLSGELVRVYNDLGRLNAPWGVAIAPSNFGLLSNMLLVGNFGGAGKIAAFDQTTGRFIDFVRDGAGEVVGIQGLWGLMFGNGASLGDTNALYFAAGPENEAAGLFGSLRYSA
jgi:uncharacterized protein (TIGR03118 family)